MEALLHSLLPLNIIYGEQEHRIFIEELNLLLMRNITLTLWGTLTHGWRRKNENGCAGVKDFCLWCEATAQWAVEPFYFPALHHWSYVQGEQCKSTTWRMWDVNSDFRVCLVFIIMWLCHSDTVTLISSLGIELGWSVVHSLFILNYFFKLLALVIFFLKWNTCHSKYNTLLLVTIRRFLFFKHSFNETINSFLQFDSTSVSYM